jgi:hypothetical protein
MRRLVWSSLLILCGGGAWTVDVTGRCLALTLAAADLGKVKNTPVAYCLGVAKRTAQEAGIPWWTRS